MATRAAALLAMVAVSGCKYGPDAFNCTDDTSCGAAGRCEANHVCSFPDTACTSGRKYGELGGTESGKCVERDLAPDAGIPPIDASSGGSDVGPDARVCFGSAPFTICLASPPAAPLALTSQIDTGSSALCVATVSGATGYCVLVGTTINITGKLRATGAKPLVLIASDSITVIGTIDVGSHRGETPETGAGADPGSCAPGTGPGLGGGGGAGGSFAGLGGNGGLGGFGGAGGVAGSASGTVTTVRGGCPGQDGHGLDSGKGPKGHGGGAVFLIAGSKIDVQASAVVNAAGEGGGGALTGSFGGGGGGAGGMIGFDAPTITCAGGALLLATGGGGGEGANNNSAGRSGADPTTTAPASGGDGNLQGGNGGNGSVDAANAGGNGAAGDGGSPRGGGGGGGGGAGLIKVLSSGAFCTQLAPPATR